MMDQVPASHRFGDSTGSAGLTAFGLYHGDRENARPWSAAFLDKAGLTDLKSVLSEEPKPTT